MRKICVNTPLTPLTPLEGGFVQRTMWLTTYKWQHMIGPSSLVRNIFLQFRQRQYGVCCEGGNLF